MTPQAPGGVSKSRPANYPRRAMAVATALGGTAGGGGGGSDGGAPAPPVATNNAPSISADARALAGTGTNISLTATGSDPDGDTLSYTWTQTRGEAVSNPTGADAASFSFDAPAEVETLTFTVTVSDGSLSDSTTVQVVLLENVDDAVFIDAAFTGGSSDGSIDAPFTALRDAVESGSATADYYIKSLANSDSYDISGTNPFDELELESNRSEERRVGKECRSRWSPYH